MDTLRAQTTSINSKKRKVEVLKRPTIEESGTVRMTDKGKVTTYRIDIIPGGPKLVCRVLWTKAQNVQPHHVDVSRDGSCSCDCPDSIFRLRTCKHAEETPDLLRKIA